MMKRRKFLQSAATGVVVPSILNGLPIHAYSNNDWLNTLVNPSVDTDHVLVLIYLGGGNDGLNTVVPLDQLTALANARPNVKLDPSLLLKLNGANNVGLHPSMQGFQNLFNEKKLNIVQSVGYPVPDFSHFRSTDIWASGSDTFEVLDSGWLGRYLNQEYPGFPLDYPNTVNPDPLAVQIGANLPLLFQGPNAQMSMNVSNPDIFNQWPTGLNDPAPNSFRGKELSYIRTISRQSKTYADKLVQAYYRGTNVGNYPTGNYLADILKVIARVIKGGMKTRLYLVSLYGFDTHAEQLNVHSTLLNYLSQGVFAFQKDLEAMSIDERVLGMTFSEFGRRIKDNASLGTDHGAGAPLFVFGSKVQSGVIGSNPFIPAVVTENDNVPMQYDFRSVYSTILKDWFCVNNQNAKDILLKDYPTLPLIKNECSTTSVDDYHQKQASLKLSVSPNPVTQRATIAIEVEEGQSVLQLFDPLGRFIKIIYRGKLSAGAHQLSFENENYAPGNYTIRLQNGQSQKLIGIQILN
ncbi:MAG: DUF1501 domain-containing protein [Bacteroidota bacterium]|nr:DUF1501 domain-containing protein [Bacteroidota bacterium]